MSDERMVKKPDTAPTSTAAKPTAAKIGTEATDPQRGSRAVMDRALTESRALTEDERLAEFRKSLYQSTLPDLPPIPGYHVCWLTTTNSRDPLQSRIRLGYEPVKPEDIPGWEAATLKTGEYAGFIGVNEMLAFKIPLSLYHMYMKESHHDAPLREEQKLQDTLDSIKKEAERKGAKLLVGDGTAELADEREGSFSLS